jgi:hypothetical protein
MTLEGELARAVQVALGSSGIRMMAGWDDPAAALAALEAQEERAARALAAASRVLEELHRSMREGGAERVGAASGAGEGGEGR